ncbi:MAG: GNAT family N-acetyltransferase [Lentisphaeria bacterium]|nr:GNAT family N-acetyltransferase [Lentisphaeria bacterium]
MNTPSFRFSADYNDIAAIHDALYSYNLTKTGAERVDVSAARFPEQQAMLACDQSGKAHGGIAFHWLNEPRRIFVDYFFLDESIRGCGFGRRIFEEFSVWAKQSGAKEIELTTNTFQAPNFYLKMGFQITHSEPAPVPLLAQNIHYSLRKVL